MTIEEQYQFHAEPSNIVLHFGPMANHVGVHYWNTINAVKNQLRHAKLMHQKGLFTMPNCVIVDTPLPSTVEDKGGAVLEPTSWLFYNSTPFDMRYYHPWDAELVPFKQTVLQDDLTESVRHMAEYCDKLKEFPVFLDLYPGNEAFQDICVSTMEQLQDDYPRKRRIVFGMLPSNVIHKQTLLTPLYKAALINSLLKHAKSIENDPWTNFMLIDMTEKDKFLDFFEPYAQTASDLETLILPESRSIVDFWSKEDVSNNVYSLLTKNNKLENGLVADKSIFGLIWRSIDGVASDNTTTFSPYLQIVNEPVYLTVKQDSTCYAIKPVSDSQISVIKRANLQTLLNKLLSEPFSSSSFQNNEKIDISYLIQSMVTRFS